MTNKEIREKETAHVKHELGEQQKHLFALRTQAVTEKLEDPSQLTKTRRTIARIKTILRERDLKEQKETAAKAPAKAEAVKAEPAAAAK
jgi:large subunit ribosomal protein L29